MTVDTLKMDFSYCRFERMSLTTVLQFRGKGANLRELQLQCTLSEVPGMLFVGS